MDVVGVDAVGKDGAETTGCEDDRTGKSLDVNATSWGQGDGDGKGNAIGGAWHVGSAP